MGVKTTQDPYVFMGKDQLISMIHFLVKREDERAQENQELKDMVKELRDTHKQDVKTQSNLMKSIDRQTNQVADLTTQNKTLQQKVNDLLSQISVGNKVRFGSTSQKGTKKKAAPVQNREKDKDDFDGTNGAAMSSNQQADAASAEETESAEQTRKSFEYRKGMKYQTMFAILLFYPHRIDNLLNATPYKNIYGAAIRIIGFAVAIPMSIAFINVCYYTTWTARQGRLTLQYYLYHALIIPPNSAVIIPPLIMIADKLNIPMSFISAIIIIIVITIGIGLVLKIPYVKMLTNPSSFFVKKKKCII